ncbi:NUDIX domain-containing protein [Paraflavisolibacter sp. H34]|uniref:NUDIX domain-containing protein n=1 Tax=Huijunlia imazamoxiresistens TaxID=3127457 RepID=UPI00301942D1
MPTRQSAGILLYRFRDRELEVFLVHPGGPLWAHKDTGAWSVPKGEFTDEEDPLAAARRELQEETGFQVSGPFLPLTPIVQKAGKKVVAWALEQDVDAADFRCSSYFPLQWPPGSGQWKSFPETDKGAWFGLAEAREKINPKQAALLEELQQLAGTEKRGPQSEME